MSPIFKRCMAFLVWFSLKTGKTIKVTSLEIKNTKQENDGQCRPAM